MNANPVILWLRRLLYLVVVCAGLYWPLSRIAAIEFPAVEPTVIRVPATLYDPYDPFRGRYVRVALEPWEIANIPKSSSRNSYAVASINQDGSCTPTAIFTEPPTELKAGEVLLKGITTHPYGKESCFALPSQRYFTNEAIAPEAEKLLSRAREKSANLKIEALVCVYADGFTRITSLMVDGTPIEQYIRMQGNIADTE